MAEQRLSYDRLQKAAGRELLRYTFLRGQGGALVFLWSLGIAVFITVLSAPLYAVPWTLANAGFIAFIARGYARSRAVREELIRSIMERRYPGSQLTDKGLQTGLQNAVSLYAEIALKIAEIERGRGADADLRQILADSDGMLSLQFASSKQAEEFERALEMIGAQGTQGPRSTPSEASRLQQENLAAITKEANAARDLAGEIGGQIQVMMLQVFQMAHRPDDVVHTQELAQQSRERLERTQDQVNNNREAAQSVLDILMPS